jgi:hypothetical protein
VGCPPIGEISTSGSPTRSGNRFAISAPTIQTRQPCDSLTVGFELEVGERARADRLRSCVALPTVAGSTPFNMIACSPPSWPRRIASVARNGVEPRPRHAALPSPPPIWAFRA